MPRAYLFIFILLFLALLHLYISNIWKKNIENTNAYLILSSNEKSIYSSLFTFFQLKFKKCNKGDYVLLVPLKVLMKISKLLDMLSIRAEAYSEDDNLIKINYKVSSESTIQRDRILWNKLRAWSIIKYDKIVLLDNDIIVRKNIDELFEQKEFSAVPAVFPNEKVLFWDPNNLDEFIKVGKTEMGKDGLNGGVMVLKPDLIIFNDLIHNLHNMQNRTCCPVQEFLFRYFEKRKKYQRLPRQFNMRKFFRSRDISVDEIYLYHFVERKKPLSLGRVNCQDIFGKEWWIMNDLFESYMKILCNKSRNKDACEEFENIKKYSLHFDIER